MVSLKDIAQRCGVSTATVSKALHDQKDIGAETKNRIKKIAKEMGYLPNAAARVLKTNESNNIGVLYFDEAAMGLTHEYFAGVLNGIKAQAEMLGLILHLSIQVRSEKNYHTWSTVSTEISMES